MVIDTSALTAILLGEPEGPHFIELIAAADDPVISAATLLEASIVMHAKTGDPGVSDLDELIAASAIRIVAVDSGQAVLARRAFLAYGKGHAPAGLNYGDCFSYALAKALGRPLLFKGLDFARTDLPPARS
jgi:ribonuclease VapC